LGEFASSMLVINALPLQTDARKTANDAKTLEEIESQNVQISEIRKK